MTKSATKVRKANTLIDILENLTASKTLDEMATRRLAREARALMDSDASGAHTVLGGIASLEGNAAKVHEHYETAVRLSSQRNPTLANYATALTNIGEMDEAFRTILKAHEAAPDDLEFLDAAIGIAGEGAKFCQIRVLDERRKKLRPNERKNEETCTRAAEAIDRGAFTERGAQEVARIAHQIRADAKARYAGSVVTTLFGEPDRFGLNIYVHTSPAEAADLNEKLANQVVEDDQLLKELDLNFVPMFIGTRSDGSDSTGTA